jgi:cellulose synthase operon protein C
MRNLRRQLVAACILACFGASVAFACSAVFPWQLLDNRAATLDTMPVNTNSFAYVEAHLVPSPKDFMSPEEIPYSYGEPHNDVLAEAVAQAEVAGLSSDQAEIVRQMRAETSGDLAFSKGALLPASIRLYTAGAVDFHKGDTSKAIARFQAILDLPQGKRRDRAVWAAYMLGRLYGREGNVAQASRAFALTRELHVKNTPDPLGLGVASYGEEARLHLDRARRIQKAKPMSPEQQQKYRDEIGAAVRLYAEQAARGSTVGIDSLRRVVDEVLGDDSAVAASICDPLVQRLLVTRTLQGEAVIPYGFDNTPTGISQLVNSVQKCPSNNNITAADQLAAIAYRDGDYRLAQNLASQSNTSLASWVKARLAMQKGDVAGAAKYYAEASKAFPSSGDSSSDDATQAILVGENGVLALSRGEYIDALEQLYPYAATFWGDVAYIAERVLTVDELKTFVDSHKDAQTRPFIDLDTLDLPEANSEIQREAGLGWFEDRRDPAAQLRDLLARRLVRAGRYQESLNYFSPPEVQTSIPSVPQMVPGSGAPVFRMGQSITRRSVSGGNTGVAVGLFPLGLASPPQVRKASKEDVAEGAPAEYVRALNDASTAQSSIDRARGWYRAAALVGDIKSGMEIMGYEGPPDGYTWGAGQSELGTDDRFVTDDERRRFNASAAQPDFVYHYRFIAVDEALRAAELLPPRSEAFAAVLCNATSWVIWRTSCPVSAVELRAAPVTEPSLQTPVDTNPFDLNTSRGVRSDLTCQLYQRYLKEGAVLPLATHFGRHCPEPDFASAVQFVQAQEIREAHRHSQIVRHRWIVLVKLVLVALCLGASTWWFLRHRYA